MRKAHIQTALLLVLSVAIVIGGRVIFRQSARLADYERLHAQDARTIDQLRAALRQEQAQPPAPAAPAPQALPAPPAHPEAPDASTVAARETAIQQLSHELDDAKAGMARLQAQLQSSDQEKQNALTAAAEDLRKREQEWRDRMDSLERQLDSARAETEAVRERSASLEADLKKGNGAASSRAAELSKTIAGLQDVDRRRDVYLSSIIRRYREITGQFRAMSGVLDSSHGSEPAPFSGIALSRIQNAISLAEDDLHRLNELNAQAQQLENKLAKD